ncbi:hypothetical protein BT67DRAFT_23442 [Trichocladium antarcticum]|uniref:Uncharacterized protein n=1 Tax=Trichocladium antarcticum TaxID=1450529 RepID=A0AAN6ZI74_9PEZI|nr:hypothetical protein BT67DRAFT_23442 [Trichocladium antarcticum]
MESALVNSSASPDRDCSPDATRCSNARVGPTGRSCGLQQHNPVRMVVIYVGRNLGREYSSETRVPRIRRVAWCITALSGLSLHDSLSAPGSRLQHMDILASSVERRVSVFCVIQAPPPPAQVWRVSRLPRPIMARSPPIRRPVTETARGSATRHGPISAVVSRRLAVSPPTGRWAVFAKSCGHVGSAP